MLSDEFIKTIISFISKGQELTCGQICNKCTDGCTCYYRNTLARDALIEAYIPIAQNVALKYINKGYDAVEEITAVAMLSLTVTVDKLTDKIYLPSGYVKTCVSFDVLDFVITNSLIRVPRSAKGYEFLRNISGGGASGITKITPDMEVELQDYIDSIVKDTKDKIVLDCLRKGGYSVEQIGHLCSVSDSRVCQIKSKLQKQFAGELLG